MKEESNLSFLYKETKGQRGKLLTSAIFSALSTILMYAPYVSAYLIIQELIQTAPNMDYVKNIAFITAGIIIARFILLGVSGVYSHIAAYDILYQLRAKTMAHLGRLPLGYFSKATTGDLKKTINEDIEKVEHTLAHQFPDVVSAIVAPVVIFIYLLSVDWMLTLFLFIPLILSYFTQMLMFRKLKENMTLYHTHLSDMNTAFVEYIRGMAVFKAFNMTSKSFSKLRNAIENYENMWVKMTKQQSLPYSLFVVLTDAAPLVIIPVGGYRVLNGTLEVSAYLLFLLLSMTFLAALKQLMDLARDLSMVLEGISRLKNIWATPVQATGSIILPKEEITTLAFNDVSFAYDNDKYVLQHVDLQVNKGETIAFVGASGAGKSTAAELAAHFFEVNKGEITLNHTTLSDIEESNLMDHIAFVFQDTFLMDDTMWANVTMGGNYTTQQVEEACKAAEIHDFICSLPQGYDTQLGEAGVKVSGGQKQRFAIARAILKDAPLIILDEATSHSDIENERKIQRALNHLLQDKMAIIIAHRLHTIQHATRIYVFDEGRIVESGTHQELQEKKGTYYEMWQAYTIFNREGNSDVS